MRIKPFQSTHSTHLWLAEHQSTCDFLADHREPKIVWLPVTLEQAKTPHDIKIKRGLSNPQSATTLPSRNSSPGSNTIVAEAKKRGK